MNKKRVAKISNKTQASGAKIFIYIVNELNITLLVALII